MKPTKQWRRRFRPTPEGMPYSFSFKRNMRETRVGFIPDIMHGVWSRTSVELDNYTYEVTLHFSDQKDLLVHRLNIDP